MISHIKLAEITGKRQDNVKRTIQDLESKGIITFTQFEEKGDGRPLIVYQVNERDSYVVIAKLDAKFTASLVDFWMTSREDVSKPEMTTGELIQANVLALEKLSRESTDKSIATMTVTDIADRLKIKPKEVNHTLTQLGFQTCSYVGSSPSYHITPKGMSYAIKATSNNCKISQLRWLSTILVELS